jgi:hypothetical protein
MPVGPPAFFGQPHGQTTTSQKVKNKSLLMLPRYWDLN